MRELNFKSDFPDLVRTTKQLEEATQTSPTTRLEQSKPTSTVSKVPLLTGPFLLLEKLTGALLGGVAVTVILGNLLISICLLLLGPSVMLELLAELI